MAEFRYVKELLASFGEIFRKPVLLLPFVYILVLSTIFLFIGPNTYILSDGTVDYNLLVWMIGIALIQAIISVAFKGMGLIGIRDYVNEQEVTHKNQVLGGLAIYWKLLLLSVLQLLIIAVPVALAFAIHEVFKSISFTAGIVALILLVALLIVYFIFAVYYLMFSSIIIAYSGKSAMDALSDSYNYAKKNVSHTLLTVLTIAISGLIIFIAVIILMLPLLFVQAETAILVQNIILLIVAVPISAAFTLFLFKAWNNQPANEKKAGHEFDEKLMDVPPKTAAHKTAKPAAKHAKPAKKAVKKK